MMMVVVMMMVMIFLFGYRKDEQGNECNDACDEKPTLVSGDAWRCFQYEDKQYDRD